MYSSPCPNLYIVTVTVEIVLCANAVIEDDLYKANGSFALTSKWWKEKERKRRCDVCARTYVSWFLWFMCLYCAYSQSAQTRITQFYLQITLCMPFLRKRSPDGATPNWRRRHPIAAIQLIYRPPRDERLSWSGWFTYSERFSHISSHFFRDSQRQQRRIRNGRPSATSAIYREIQRNSLNFPNCLNFFLRFFSIF